MCVNLSVIMEGVGRFVERQRRIVEGSRSGTVSILEHNDGCRYIPEY